MPNTQEGRMIHSIEFTEKWRCFKAGDRFDFRPGVNLLVGDQGCGKSSLLGALQGAGMKETGLFGSLEKKTIMKRDACKVFMMDFEKENPRTKGHFDEDIRFQMAAKFSSHGECNLALISALATADDCLVMMDEPDTALSIRSCAKLVKQLKEVADRSSQVIAAVHNISVIQGFDEVLSLEHRGWMRNEVFITSQLIGV
jgi:predicted ATPase